MCAKIGGDRGCSHCGKGNDKSQPLAAPVVLAYGFEFSEFVLDGFGFPGQARGLLGFGHFKDAFGAVFYGGVELLERGGRR